MSCKIKDAGDRDGDEEDKENKMMDDSTKRQKKEGNDGR